MELLILEELAHVRGLIPTRRSSALIFARHFPVKMLLMLMEPTAHRTQCSCWAFHSPDHSSKENFRQAAYNLLTLLILRKTKDIPASSAVLSAWALQYEIMRSCSLVMYMLLVLQSGYHSKWSSNDVTSSPRKFHTATVLLRKVKKSWFSYKNMNADGVINSVLLTSVSWPFLTWHCNPFN